MLRVWDRRRSPSANPSTTTSSRSLAVASSVTSDQRSEHLSSSDNGLDGVAMTTDQWASLASALGLNTADEQTIFPESNKIAHKVRKRRHISDKDLLEVFTNLLVAIVTPYPRLLIARRAPFNREAVPLDIPKFGMTNSHLLTPRPTIVVGYNPQVFSSYQLELQQGIISDIKGEPQDLFRISQTVSGMCWPFLVLDIDEKSMINACNGCSAGTATCNNALTLLAGALMDDPASSYDEYFVRNLSKTVHSFSIAVSGKAACLMSHNSEASMEDAVSIVRTYDIDQEKDVQALAGRIRSIVIWAQKARLQGVMDLLDRLDRRVNFRESTKVQETVTKLPLEYAVPDTDNEKKKKGVLKSVVAESMPSWSRVKV